MYCSKLVVVVILVPFFAQSFRFVIAVAKHSYWLKVSCIVIRIVGGVMCLCIAYSPRGLF